MQIGYDKVVTEKMHGDTQIEKMHGSTQIRSKTPPEKSRVLLSVQDASQKSAILSMIVFMRIVF